ncbi:MAG: NDP-sugar synthase [Blastocatellia bacterium]|nr:NDP-sugar synthase [Blastocatellia bacterium]MCS7156938.1 NDP-sugar synthase [Blastocatellia bacterium]MDW8167630.1 NDP-sugar synthase [Acidobacteriota bacterium]MDW8256230.1 NDP-sugar synthase [Acidobacteriota bacterium]
MRAMILAAGLGTRLWPLTADRAKAAVPFLNKPIIVRLIEYLKHYGFTDVIINLHHQGESIRRVVGDGSAWGVRVFYSEEPEILGTGGALDKVRHLLQDETFLVINGKIITDIDLHAVCDAHRRRAALATLVLMKNLQRERFSIVEVDGDGKIVRFGGMPSPQEMPGDHAPLLFTGIQVVEPEIFDFIPRGVFSHTTMDVYPRAIASGQCIAAYIAEGQWYELSTLERYLNASLAFLRREGRSFIAGEGTVIEDDAEVRESVLWERVRIGRGARLRQCIIGDDVTIPPGSDLERVAVVRAALCPSPSAGTIVGQNLLVPF